MPQDLKSAICLLAPVFAIGCTQMSSEVTSNANSWSTYTSPDGRVSFKYPPKLKITQRIPKDEADPQIALLASDSDQSIQITLVVRISDAPRPDFCQNMMEACLDQVTTALSDRRSISIGNAKGLRQEFRESKPGIVSEYIAVAIELHPVYVHFTSGHHAKKPEMKVICEKVLGTLTVTNP